MSGAVEQTFVAADGAELPGCVFSRPGKPLLLVFPGFGYTHRLPSFQRLLARLPYDIVVIDNRAHGNEQEFGVERLCDDIVHFTTIYARKRPDLIVFGHSLSATALLMVAPRMPPSVRFALFAPFRSISHRVPAWGKMLIRAVRPFPPLSRLVLRLGLFITNVRTGNIRRTGLRGVFSRWGDCRIKGASFNEFWDLSQRFVFDFPRVRQKGIIIYGWQDHLIRPFDVYERNVRSTGLRPVLLPIGHYFKDRDPKEEERIQRLLADALASC